MQSTLHFHFTIFQMQIVGSLNVLFISSHICPYDYIKYLLLISNKLQRERERASSDWSYIYQVKKHMGQKYIPDQWNKLCSGTHTHTISNTISKNAFQSVEDMQGCHFKV